MCGDDHTAGVEDGDVFDSVDDHHGLQSQWWRSKLVANGTALSGLQADSADHDASRSRRPSGRGEAMQEALETKTPTGEQVQRHNRHSLECSLGSAIPLRISERAAPAYQTTKTLQFGADSTDSADGGRERSVSECGKRQEPVLKLVSTTSTPAAQVGPPSCTRSGKADVQPSIGATSSWRIPLERSDDDSSTSTRSRKTYRQTFRSPVHRIDVEGQTFRSTFCIYIPTCWTFRSAVLKLLWAFRPQ